LIKNIKGAYGQMILRDIFRASFFCLLVGSILSGCTEKKSFTLDKDDIRFVGFYSDYLLVSGISGEKGPDVLNTPNSADIQALLLQHALTRESLNHKTEVYKQNPDLWREVLLQVRENIRKKSALVK